MKINPCLEIPFEDYENHMSDHKVGQLKILSKITGNILVKYKPETFAASRQEQSSVSRFCIATAHCGLLAAILYIFQSKFKYFRYSQCF